MKWIRFTIQTTTEAEDIIISDLYDIGLEGAQIEDKIPLTPLEKEQMFAGIMIAVIPTIIVYCIFANQIVEGLTAGAVKG